VDAEGCFGMLFGLALIAALTGFALIA